MAAGISITKDDASSVLRSLASWQGEMKSFYSVSEVLKLTQLGNGQSRQKTSDMLGGFGIDLSAAPRGCEHEQPFFLRTGLLLPPTQVSREEEPDLLNLIFKLKPPKVGPSAKAIVTYVKNHWMVNVTLSDRDWHKHGNELLDMGRDPFESADQFYQHTGLNKPLSLLNSATTASLSSLL